MSPARKPVIVRKISRDWSSGYASSTLDDQSESLELLESGGKLQSIPWISIKWVCFVRELLTSSPDPSAPERLLRRNFATRPRTAGLWLRLSLTDGDEIEGLAANDRSLIDGPGLLLTPPDTRSNTQRIYIPRSAIRELTLLAVIGTPAKSPHAASRYTPTLQTDLFPRD